MYFINSLKHSAKAVSSGFLLFESARFAIRYDSDSHLGLHNIARLILILYYLSSIFKTIIDTIFIQYLYTVFDTISRMWCQECKESCIVLKITFQHFLIVIIYRNNHNSINFGSCSANEMIE